MSETQETLKTEKPHGIPAQTMPDSQTSTEVKKEQETAKKAVESVKESIKEPPKRDVSLTGNRLKQAEYTRTIFTATVERGHTRSDLVDPKYWAHIALKLKRGDRIEVTAEDGSFYAELMVIACDRTWAQVHVLTWHDLSASTVKLTPEVLQEYMIDFKGPEYWCVIRRSDNMVIQNKMNTEGEAKIWLEGFIRNRSAA